MFENPKYITRGVQGEIPDSLMLLMWQMIAAMQTSQKDYLQVFTLTKTPTGQHIVHTQEQPPYRKPAWAPAPSRTSTGGIWLKCMSLMTKRTAPCC